MRTKCGFRSLRDVYAVTVKLKDVEDGFVDHFIGPEKDRKNLETDPRETEVEPTSLPPITLTSFLYVHFGLTAGLRRCSRSHSYPFPKRALLELR